MFAVITCTEKPQNDRQAYPSTKRKHIMTKRLRPFSHWWHQLSS